MDYGYITEFALSLLIFAPGLVLLALFAFVGLMLAIEKVRGAQAVQAPSTTQTVSAQEIVPNPAPGAVVSGLNGSISAADSAAQEPKATGTSS